MGEDFGTTIGTVYAQFVFTNTSSSASSSLGSMGIDTKFCTNLTYSVRSSNIREVIYLSTDDRSIEEDFSYVHYRFKISADIRDYSAKNVINPS